MPTAGEISAAWSLIGKKRLAESQDIQRLRGEYEARKNKYANSDKYSILDSAHNFFVQSRMRHLLTFLRKYNHDSLEPSNLLEIGCGSGGVLAEYLYLGISPENLFGIDLLLDRLKEAKSKLPASHIHNANAELLPFRKSSFDFVLQYTAFSSILDPSIKTNAAKEMIRVLKPGGVIIWYDFLLNPTNRQTQGIKPGEIKELFPHCNYDFHRITLAPPIARWLVPKSIIFSMLLEKLKLFNSHYLVAIHPKEGTTQP